MASFIEWVYFLIVVFVVMVTVSGVHWCAKWLVTTWLPKPSYTSVDSWETISRRIVLLENLFDLHRQQKFEKMQSMETNMGVLKDKVRSLDNKYGRLKNDVSSMRRVMNNGDRMPVYAGYEHLTNRYGANGYAANGYPANGYPANGYPANGNPANGYPANGYPTNGYPANGYPANGYPANGYMISAPSPINIYNILPSSMTAVPQQVAQPFSSSPPTSVPFTVPDEHVPAEHVPAKHVPAATVPPPPPPPPPLPLPPPPPSPLSWPLSRMQSIPESTAAGESALRPKLTPARRPKITPEMLNTVRLKPTTHLYF